MTIEGIFGLNFIFYLVVIPLRELFLAGTNLGEQQKSWQSLILAELWRMVNFLYVLSFLFGEFCLNSRDLYRRFWLDVVIYADLINLTIANRKRKDRRQDRSKLENRKVWGKFYLNSMMGVPLCSREIFRFSKSVSSKELTFNLTIWYLFYINTGTV